ncbi:MAG: hypothetical protein BGO26_06850 [Actinobacteria bacterium 69-20]|nr:hypothetical protein [Actinomycetota bacterium]OJV30094.1 MAG: hypothetical protein BGO26_06850 [Actinobacteria bacterium 69-20]
MPRIPRTLIRTVNRTASAAFAAVVACALLAGCSGAASNPATSTGSGGTAHSGSSGSAAGDTGSGGSGESAQSPSADEQSSAAGTDSSDTGGGAGGDTAGDTGGSGSGSAGAAASEGSVTLDIASGPHAGTHTRTGDLKCQRYGDGFWMVFSPDGGGADDIAMMNLYWMPQGVDAANSPFAGKHQLLEVKFGSPIASGDNAITLDDAGGSLEFAVPSIANNGYPVFPFLAKTADGVDIKVTTTVPECPAAS